jgi:probable DNA metabolism protein
MQFVFDGTYKGFITAVFDAFERKEFQVDLIEEKSFQPDFFRQAYHVISEDIKFKRVINGLKKIITTAQLNQFYVAYLSEDPLLHQASFRIIIQLFKIGNSILDNYGDTDVLYFYQTIKKVSRERHRMKAFVRFSKSNDGMYVSMVEPDFNVLPLIISFFKNRYTDQPWLIYDMKRNYGIYYNTQFVEEVQLLLHERQQLQKESHTIELDIQEERYQRLWQQYFKSTNIEVRKNLKLHIQHVPKRYWKYLVEKQIH